MSNGRFFSEPLERRRLLSVTPVSAEFLVNTFTTGAQTRPAAAMDADGNFVVAWQSNNQDGSSYGIYAQRYAASGLPQGAEFRVNTFTSNTQRSPAVAMDADGEFVIVWESFGQDGSGYGVYAQRYDATGAAAGTEFRVNTFTTNRQSHPAVAMDSTGGFVVVWASLAQDGSGESVQAQRFDATGIAQGSEFRVNSFTPNNQGDPSVAMDAAGNFVVAWHSNGQDGSGSSVHGQRFNASGATLGGEFPINSFTTGNQWSPVVAMDNDGDFVIAWESYQQDGDHYGIFAQRYDATGTPVGDEFRVNTTTTGGQRAPAIAVGADGEFVIAWQGPDANGNGLYLQGYAGDGTPHDIELRANQTQVSAQSAAAAAMGVHGEIVVAWQSFAQDGNGYGVYARRYQMLPGVIGAGFVFRTAPQTVEFRFDEDVSASLGTDDIIIQDLSTMQTIPAGDLAVSYDALTNTAVFSYIGSAAGLAGMLPDGNYRATLLAAGVTTPAGIPLPADYNFDFFFMQGDANHDARVNLADFNILAANFGQSPQDFTRGDFNYDGVVNLADFNILAARFGTILTSMLRGVPGAGQPPLAMSSGGGYDDDLPADLLA